MYICKHCGAHLDAGEKCDCGGENPEQKSKNQVETFTIRAARCRRCNEILTSEYGLKNGIGQCCRKKEIEERPLENQISLF